MLVVGECLESPHEAKQRVAIEIKNMRSFMITVLCPPNVPAQPSPLVATGNTLCIGVSLPAAVALPNGRYRETRDRIGSVGVLNYAPTIFGFQVRRPNVLSIHTRHLLHGVAGVLLDCMDLAVAVSHRERVSNLGFSGLYRI